MSKKIPTSLFSRGTKLMGLATRLATSEIVSRVKSWEDEKDKIKSKIEMAHAMVKTLSELKGASMKLGQLLSMDLGEYLPPEVIKVLETLHQNSTFLPIDDILEILRRELGPKLNDFINFSEVPLAAASIGQVHAAILHNESVVVKIQYPGVADSIPSDLKMLKTIFKNLVFLQGKSLDLDPFFDELSDVLSNETNYFQEKEMLILYRKNFLDSNYIIPRVYSEYSTSNVITMEKIEGTKLNDWIDKASSEEKFKIAEDFMNLFLIEFFSYGLVQTDPNPGNFLITKDNKIALLDFGAVKQYDRKFVEGYKTILRSAIAYEHDLVLLESMKLSFIDPRESEEIKKIYLEMMEFLVSPFRLNQPFDFTDKNFFDGSQKLSWELVKKCKYSPPPKDLLFLHRKLAGVFFLIKKLEAKLVLKDYWDKING